MVCADGIKERIKPMFDGFYDSLMFSYFDGIFGRAYCDDINCPKCAVIVCGDFYFIAGSTQFGKDVKALMENNPYAVAVPDSESWVNALNSCGKKMLPVSRFHTMPPQNGFNVTMLKKRVDRISDFPKYKLEMIDREYYEKALKEDWSSSFVSNFKDFEDYSKHGFGYIITNNNEIISGTSAYSYYSGGVEIEVSTREQFRLKGLAQITASAFLLECVKRGLTPHWDARNRTSLSIAEKMGFVFKDEYLAMEFDL
ncbi:MAG: GNAT family N-acetyltransferase [Oscillospiraceae bacterium]